MGHFRGTDRYTHPTVAPGYQADLYVNRYGYHDAMKHVRLEIQCGPFPADREFWQAVLDRVLAMQEAEAHG